MTACIRHASSRTTADDVPGTMVGDVNTNAMDAIDVQDRYDGYGGDEAARRVRRGWGTTVV